MGVRKDRFSMSYRCLVCAYDQMPHPPRDYNICPCCGSEYGVDDVFESHAELRDEWLRAGGPWFSRISPYNQPPNWNAWNQLDLAGYAYSVERPQTRVKKVLYSPPIPAAYRVFGFTRNIAAVA